MATGQLQGRKDLPGGLSLRPYRDNLADKSFVSKLVKDNRDDIRAAEGERDYLESVVEMQERAMETGYGNDFGDAAHFIVEKMGVNVGRLLVESGGTEVRIVDLQFIPEAQDLGYGPIVIGAMQMAAAQQRVQLAITVLSNRPKLKQWLSSKGFVVEETDPAADRMVWSPTGDAMNATWMFNPGPQ